MHCWHAIEEREENIEGGNACIVWSASWIMTKTHQPKSQIAHINSNHIIHNISYRSSWRIAIVAISMLQCCPHSTIRILVLFIWWINIFLHARALRMRAHVAFAHTWGINRSRTRPPVDSSIYLRRRNDTHCIWALGGGCCTVHASSCSTSAHHRILCRSFVGVPICNLYMLCIYIINVHYIYTQEYHRGKSL